jgi:hypothetical protein
MRGELADVERLKSLLDQFSAATGLHGNYHKSTAVPMHMSEDDIPRCISALGCKREGFPQTYLGLPLSCEKLDCLLLIHISAKQIGIWQGVRHPC